MTRRMGPARGLRRAALGTWLIAQVAVAAAVAEPACLGPPEPVVVAGVAGPATLRLSDGRRVRLADLRIADTKAAARRLQRLAVGSRAVLRPSAGPGRDRYGRVRGDVVLRATGHSLSETLVRAGLAFVDPTVMPRGCHGDLFSAEREAEAAGRGIWTRPAPILEAGNVPVDANLGRYVVVTGTVEDVGESRRTVFLNFGVDYRTDFTALVRKADAKGWEDELEALAGQRVRVRGVLEAWNGGLIRVEHPSQIERR
jgi:endonuclease YncB( thermonuclease family)